MLDNAMEPVLDMCRARNAFGRYITGKAWLSVCWSSVHLSLVRDGG